MGRRFAGVLHRLREGSKDAHGFSLVELLVVILIIGVLAAISIPAFAGQKGKAMGAQAKEVVRTAETTAESIATDSNGDYKAISPAELNRHETTIPIVPSTKSAYLSAAKGEGSSYSVTATVPDGTEFTITRSGTGAVIRTCASPLTKAGCSGQETGSW
jgi:type IV pilus assembly protein PilA